MRSSDKKLSILQQTHFNNKLQEATKLIREGWNRKAYILINQELERSQMKSAGWRTKIQFIRRGIICLIRILQSYIKVKNENQNLVVIKLHQYIQQYYLILDNQADELVLFYSKELLYRIAQLQRLCAQFAYDVRSIYHFQPKCYHFDLRIIIQKVLYNLHLGNVHFIFRLSGIPYYFEAIEDCQLILKYIDRKDPQLLKYSRIYFRAIRYLTVICYILAFQYQELSQYYGMVEALKLAHFFAQFQKMINFEVNVQEYVQHAIEHRDINNVLKQTIFPQELDRQEQDPQDYWMYLNNLFYEKYSSKINKNQFTNLHTDSVVTLAPTPICKSTHRSKIPTEQETTIQTVLQTPRQNDKSKGVNFNIMRPSQGFESNCSKVKKQPKQHSYNLTIDYDTFLHRMPSQEIETHATQRLKKELDSYYEQKVVQSFHGNSFSTLRSMKTTVQAQHEINKISQLDFLVGRKLLKFRKQYDQQKLQKDENRMKLLANMDKEQEFLEGLNSARNFLKVDLDLKKIYNPMQVNVEQAQYDQINIKEVISEYEQKTTKHIRTTTEPNGLSLNKKHVNLFSSINFRRNEPVKKKSFIFRK